MARDDRPARTGPDFTPAPGRYRHDGWTPERQIAFIDALAETGIVEEACRRVGMSDTSAYALRRKPAGAAFREAWEAALDYSLHLAEQDAVVRSRKGVARPIFYKGEQVGEWRHFDERLTMKQRRMSGGHPQPCPPDRAFCFICCAPGARSATASGSTGCSCPRTGIRRPAKTRPSASTAALSASPGRMRMIPTVARIRALGAAPTTARIRPWTATGKAGDSRARVEEQT